MINKRGKKAISPVIATVLLVSIVLVLGIIIFIWASKSLGEQYTKFGDPIDDACNDIQLTASYDNGEIQLVNRGRVPIYKINLVLNSGDIFDCGLVALPESGSKDIECDPGSETPTAIIPVLKGYNSNNDEIEYACDNEIQFD